MKNRRAFITALTVVSSAAVGLPMAAKARAAAGAPSVSPPPAKQPSAAALAIAATYRAFDAALSDAELQTIARNIDTARATAAKLNSRRKPLRNSDEMVARFSAAESV